VSVARVIEPVREPVRRVYSYVRWSTPEQGDGDSLRRQTAQAAAWAKAHGYELADAHMIQDAGVSAFSGDNIRSGALRTFLTMASAGEIPTGSVLYVENLDRLSRESPVDAVDTVKAIIAAGIEVVDGSDGSRYSADSMRAEGGIHFVILTVKMLRPFAESAHKRTRGKAVWEAKRENARENRKAMTARCPGWLRKAGDGYEVVVERAGIVREVFKLAARGQTAYAIADLLNRRGVVPLGGEGSWRRQQVSKLLNNRAVLGVFVPHTSVKLNGKRVRKDGGEPIPDYFPAVITAKLWEAAQVYRGARTAASRGAVCNLFGRVLRCGACGAALTRVSKGPGNAGRAYLVCDARRHYKARGGDPCTAPTLRYDLFEARLLDVLPSILADGPMWSDILLQTDVQEEAAKLAATDQARENIVSVISSGVNDPALLERLETLRIAREGYAKRLASLEGDLARLRSPAMARQRVWLETQRDLTRDRGAAALRLRTIIRAITVNTATGECKVEWAAGGPVAHLKVSTSKAQVSDQGDVKRS
jgi:DNA invertase Pin-like site-specific DNA recombinase